MQFRDKKTYLEESDDKFHQDDDNEAADVADGDTARTKNTKW
jgi:hypothetical protein